MFGEGPFSVQAQSYVLSYVGHGFFEFLDSAEQSYDRAAACYLETCLRLSNSVGRSIELKRKGGRICNTTWVVVKIMVPFGVP